jgi:glycosyltransferase involved in cell wall biosynthesis
MTDLLSAKPHFSQTPRYPAFHPVIAVIPAYNEARFIASVVFKTRRHTDLVIVVDDGSSDDTVWLAEAAGAMVVRQPNNMGKAAALNTGLALARQHGAAGVVLIDGDGQQDANDIPLLLGSVVAGEADIVVGSRFLGVASETPKWRVAGQQALTLATNVASGVPLTDSQSGFRAISGKALAVFDFKTLGFSVESEMQFLIRQHNLVAREVPIIVNYDEKPKRSPIQQGLQVLNGILRMVAQHRPLFFFGLPGGVSLLAGLYFAYRVWENYNAQPKLAIGTLILAITLVIAGLLTIFTGLILHTIRLYLHK